MKNKYYHIILLAVPGLLFLYSALMRYAEGPFYLNTLYDPCYVYLVSSLNLAQLVSPAHFDHPGIPVQVIGAIVIKITHLFNNRTGDIAVDVLSHPEFYLGVIHFFLSLINCIILFISSVVIFNAVKNIFVTLLLQLSPFTSYMVSYELSVITAETFLISVVMLLIAYSIKFIKTGKSSGTNFVLTFSIICGLGIATKLTFLPLLIIPVILLNGFKDKIKFLFLTGFLFIILFLPSISNLSYFFGWIKNLFLFDGIYGKGNPDIINTSVFFANAGKIISENPFFSMIFLMLIFTCAFNLKNLKKSGKPESVSQESKLLKAIFISMLFQLIIVAKHYSGHYIVPAVMLTITGLYLCINLSSQSGFSFNSKLKTNYIYSTLIFLILTFTVIDTVFNYKDQESKKENALETSELIENISEDGILISSYGSSSRAYALAFSVKWAGKNIDKYNNIIHSIYPNDLYFDFWANHIYSVSEKNSGDKGIKKDKKVYFLNKYLESNGLILNDLQNNYDFKEYTITEIHSSDNGEKVYEISHKK